jgi:hypothetical protein
LDFQGKTDTGYYRPGVSLPIGQENGPLIKAARVCD